ncbi:uncharacterized protein LOC131623685 isoform X2 [Vicia villosa]|uniref:uncharacterized protein LOC131623685 isoform X2 n=1 Tax=Vicia villosa TaxID=3911 RepID=UPI00273C3732|nr:uncharacterized protein LOC131623685 isoform X2 [Vicia villosa]
MEDTGEMKQELQLQLYKLHHIKSEETLNHILSTLWNTRKTGLPPSDKSHFQSLLNLSSHSQLDPVLACLRWLIRKFVYQNWSDDELLKLFPDDLPLQLQTILLLAFQKNRHRWKQDISSQQHDLLPRTTVLDQAPPSFSSAPSSSMSTSMRPRQEDDALSQLDIASSENLLLEENLPYLKSMTWTMENRGASPADRVAIITLKDCSNSPLGETELKFQLTKDTFEAMLRSLTYISEQLIAVGTTSRPANKKQRK